MLKDVRSRGQFPVPSSIERAGIEPVVFKAPVSILHLKRMYEIRTNPEGVLTVIA